MNLTREMRESKVLFIWGIAFILHMRHPLWTITTCMAQARDWWRTLEEEV